MKRLLLSIFILVLCLIFCLASYSYIDKNITELYGYLTLADNAIDDGNVSTVKENIQKTVQFWNDIKPIFRILLEGEICNNIDSEIFSAEFNIKQNDFEEVKANIINTLNILRQIIEAEKLSAQAIL